MKTQGEIESAISEGMGHFEQEYMGRGPKGMRAHLLDDLVVVGSKAFCRRCQGGRRRDSLSPIGRFLAFSSLPALWWPLLALTIVCYILLTQGVKIWLLRLRWI